MNSIWFWLFGLGITLYKSIDYLVFYNHDTHKIAIIKQNITFSTFLLIVSFLIILKILI